ncbi:MAG TPA: alpha-amylase family glycosyl hydrolase [Blastocatellia bacterium]|nr:alpha-amylase family glycosyl hydrolase [Blastocatellia bacterium]
MRIYEINTRVHASEFDQITTPELVELSKLGFDAVWLMGVWQISEGAKRISKIVSDDYEGSPYAVPDYKFNRDLGGKSRFSALVKRAHDAGLAVIVDFVSNHMAIDSQWIAERPDFFIRCDASARRQTTSEYFLHPSGEVIAFGRDPYFPPWHDTSQLDYTNPDLRRRMIEVLKWISTIADGVRCDMAMLVLRDYFRQQWYANAPVAWFDERMPGEFWDQAISEVKAARPDFKFIAETYWDKEQQLLSLGFDLAYEKKIYDGLVAHNAQAVIGRVLSLGRALKGSLYFIENHDEPRAAATFNRDDNLAAAALILSLPGSVLIHEGQMEGKRERLPVQRIKPITQEPPDMELRARYASLLTATAQRVFRDGSFHLFDTGTYGVASFMRRNEDQTVAYLGQISEAWHKFGSTPLDITPLARAVALGRFVRVINLLNSESILVEERHGKFLLRPNQLYAEDTKFCLIEVFAS